MTNTANNSIGVTANDDVDDYKSTGSVLEKLSLFEKLEQRQASTAAAVAAAAAAMAKSNSITSSGNNESQSNIRRNDDLNKSIRSIDKDPGMQFQSSLCLYVYPPIPLHPYTLCRSSKQKIQFIKIHIAFY